MRDDDAMRQFDRNEREMTDIKYVLKVKSTGLPDGSDVDHQRKSRVKDIEDRATGRPALLLGHVHFELSIKYPRSLSTRK